MDSAEWRVRKAARVMSQAYNKFPDTETSVEACKKVFDGVETMTYVGLWHAIHDSIHKSYKEE